MDNFWSVIWAVVVTFVFVAYLLVLFAIITDLFRDSGLSPWWKAVWIVALILIPFLSGLVYVVSRGRGMAGRTVTAATLAMDQTDSYITNVTSKTGAASPAERIATAQQLLIAGAITDAEYAQLEADALA